MTSSVLAKPLNIAAIDAKLYTLHGHVREWCRGLRYEDHPGLYATSQPNPLDCLECIDELLELRLKQTTTKKEP